MKFKMYKFQLKSMLDKLSKNSDFEEIEIEPVWETFAEAVNFESGLKSEYFKRGYDVGFREGFYKGEMEERYRSCGQRFVKVDKDMFKDMKFNIKIEPDN